MCVCTLVSEPMVAGGGERSAVSCLQVYEGRIRDLLNPTSSGSNLQVQEVGEDGTCEGWVVGGG